MVIRLKDSKAIAALSRITVRRRKQAATAIPLSEASLMRQCLELLKHRKVFAWRANSGGGLRAGKGGKMRPIVGNTEGTPDVLLVLPGGRLVGLELKSRTGRTRPAQIAWRANAEAAGVLYWLVRDVAELDALLAAEGVR